MIQNLLTIQHSVQKYHTLVCGDKSSKGQVQKIYSTAHLICLVVRYPGQTVHLYLGRGGGYEGFWHGDIVPDSKFRIRDHFLEYLRKYVKGSLLVNVVSDDKDRIVSLEYKNSEIHGKCYFFWKGRSLYFSNLTEDNEKNRLLFKSWESKGSTVPSDVEIEFGDIFDSIGRDDQTSDKHQIQEVDFLAEYYKKLDELTSTVLINGRKKKRFERKIEKIRDDLDRVKKWKEIVEYIKNLNYEAELPVELTISEVCFKFRRKWNTHQRIDYLYGKVKGFKKAEALLKERYKEALKECQEYIGGVRPEYKSPKIVGPVWSKEKVIIRSSGDESSSIKSEKVDYFNFLGVKCAVGKDACANDFIRSRWASPDDTWFHMDGDKGAHLILKHTTNINLHEIFTLVGSIIRDYSGISSDEINLIYAKVKDVKGVTGNAGKITYKRAKQIRVLYNRSWKEIVFTSSAVKL